MTLVEGSAFCISAPNGDIIPGEVHGLFDRDTRFLSSFLLLVDDRPVEYLSLHCAAPFSGEVVARARPGSAHAEPSLVVVRTRYVGQGMREDVVLRNFGAEPARVNLTVIVDTDFAHIFEVKERRLQPRAPYEGSASGSRLAYSATWTGVRRGVSVQMAAEEAEAQNGSIRATVVIPPKGEWKTCIEAVLRFDDDLVKPHYSCGEPPTCALPIRRLTDWKGSLPLVGADNQEFDRMITRSEDDLGSLRISDPDLPGAHTVAAGAPWFMSLFGRDSLITSWMALMIDPTLAEGSLRMLARHQGKSVDPRSEEEPGRILHELRWGLSGTGRGRSPSRYYGTADATPLFVMLLGELHNWIGDAPIFADLLPNAERAVEWIVEFGDRDGDGFVEYRRATEQGLVNQGWKDSWDGIGFADGSVAEPPLALCEVQGYVYAAYLARAALARATGDGAGARGWVDKAAELKKVFNDAFWMPQEGYFALGLDARKVQIDSITSNVGHCLWTGIVDDEKAAAVAERLVAPDMFSGFGVRTLSSDMGAYNPISYHNGSVWPHDSALVAAGLMRYGFAKEAERVVLALVDAASGFAGRLPELFSGLSRAEFSTVVPYPAACSPQAWSAATPLSLLRTLLQLDPVVPRGTLWLEPRVPAQLGTVSLEGMRLAGGEISLTCRGSTAEVRGLPPTMVLARHPRPPERTLVLA